MNKDNAKYGKILESTFHIFVYHKFPVTCNGAIQKQTVSKTFCLWHILHTLNIEWNLIWELGSIIQHRLPQRLNSNPSWLKKGKDVLLAPSKRNVVGNCIKLFVDETNKSIFALHLPKLGIILGFETKLLVCRNFSPLKPTNIVHYLLMVCT